jgi:hypothetical protein
MMRGGLLALLLMLSACEAALEPAVPPPAPPAGEWLATLAGEWRVAGIDGRAFDEPYGLALSGDGSDLWWAPRCAGFVRSYRLSGAAVRFASKARPMANDGNPAPVCLIAVPARLNEVFAALDSADRAVRTPANAIEISGGGHALLLFSQ